MTEDQALKVELLEIFRRYDVLVAVGLRPEGGVVIRSQDDRVDASNIGFPVAQELEL